MIDPNKKYTCNGNPVENIRIVLHNSNGDEVTYPVKGSIVHTSKSGRKSYEYAIWSLDGKSNIVFPNPENDLKLQI